jgi:alkylation response protein AidB-like acyl-CoA dehydrogenase
VRRWLDTHCEPKVVRAVVEADEEELQSVWRDFASQGWLGIHVPERWGGQGFGLLELAVVLEETGWSLLPGPLLPTVVASSVIAETGTDAQCGALLPGLVDGSVTAAVYLGPSHLNVLGRIDDGAIRVSGTLRPVLGAATASVMLVPVQFADDQAIWCAIDVDQLRVEGWPAWTSPDV